MLSDKLQIYPVHQALPELRTALGRGHGVLTSPPGSGKTTIIPLALLDEPWLEGQSILMLEPRRVATRGAAHRVAELSGSKIGDLVGYRIRFENRVSPNTRIEVVTEGILTRRIQKDPALEGVGLVIFDEFHERNLHADLGLALCLDAVKALREDLRLLIMSATLETERVAGILDNAPIVIAEGRSYPVDIHYLEREPQSPVDETTTAIRRALKTHEGDILAFLPGAAEIRLVAQRLEDAISGRIAIRPIYGDLPFDQQVAALNPDPEGKRRVVLATDIAETSLTIEGVSTVVDSGLAREPRLDANTGLTRLVTRQVSRASADQRAGRAGRLGPGACYRLWPQSRQQSMEAARTPEILASDLAPLALELGLWGVSDPENMTWLDSPPRPAYAQAKHLLHRLEALDKNGRITNTGRMMAALGLHPRLAHLVVQATRLGEPGLGALIAALLSERDPMPRTPGVTRPVDIEQRIQLLGGSGNNPLDTKAVGRIRRTAKQIERRLKGLIDNHATTSTRPSVGTLVALAFPDRIARARDPHSGRYQLSNGRGAILPPDDSLIGAPYLAIAHLDSGKADGRIYLAAPLDLEEIRDAFGKEILLEEAVTLDRERGAIIAHEVERLDALTLSKRQLPRPSVEAVKTLIFEEIRRAGLALLPFDQKSQSLRDRVRCLRQWQPDGDWPDWEEPALLHSLEHWLDPWMESVRGLDDLKRLDLETVFTNLLGWERRKRVDELAPSHLEVPSGHRRPLTYNPGGQTVLAVKLQEVFGLAETPRICNGKIPLLLHLLSPAGRPIQVTQDLESFWKNTYAEVKKEMKGRYPKHPWPNDPWTAQPTARVRRR